MGLSLYEELLDNIDCLGCAGKFSSHCLGCAGKFSSHCWHEIVTLLMSSGHTWPRNCISSPPQGRFKSLVAGMQPSKKIFSQITRDHYMRTYSCMQILSGQPYVIILFIFHLFTCNPSLITYGNKLLRSSVTVLNSEHL